MMTVGELVAYLRLDDGQFNRGLDQAHGRAGQMGSRIGGTIGTAVKRGAVVAGAGVAALVGTALVKGFGRLTAIENATAKLTGLGHSAAEVKVIMANALASVKGTAYGLDEAATIAAGTVAAGIKPGQDLRKTLGLVADSATIAGTSLGEMGAIWNKVAASNKIQGDVINQLNDAGVPIVQLLGKELGKTSAQVVALASAGKIHFAEFQAAMEKGLGGAALASGGTTLGSWKNMMAALSRLGASALSGIFPSFKVAFGKVTAYLDQIAAKYGDKFKKWGEKVSAAFKTGGFTGMFKAMLPAGVGDTLITTFNVIKDTTVAIVKVIGVIGKVFSVLPGALQKFAIAAGVLALALGKFGLLGSAKGLFGGLLGKVGGGAATEVPLTTAVGLNTAATEANTLALMGKGGLPGGGVPGGGGKPVPVGAPGATGWLSKLLGGFSLTQFLGMAAFSAGGAGVEVGTLPPDMIAEFKAKYGDAGQKAAAAFATSFAAGITPASMSQHGGLLQGLDPAILRTREKLAALRQELQKKNKLGDTDTASTTTAIKRVEKHLADLRANAARPAHTGRLNTAGWTGPISAAMQRLNAFLDLSSAGITPGSVSQHKSWTAANPTPVWHAPGRASGGYVPARPGGSVYTLGEGGEGETIIPDSKMGKLGGDVHVHIGQLVGTDERTARRLAEQVGQILMSKQRLKGAMSRG